MDDIMGRVSTPALIGGPDSTSEHLASLEVIGGQDSGRLSLAPL